MDITVKNEGRLQRLVLSCDTFTTGCLAMCLLFFVPYTVSSAGTLVMWFLPLAMLLPFALLPLFYMLIHRFDTLLFGRYHLIMPLAGFVSALFFVIAWSADGNGAASACAVFFGMSVFITAVLLYRYCAFSVRARLLDENITALSPYNLGCAALGGFAAVGVFGAFMYYDFSTAYLNTAYVLGGVCVLLVIVQYLTTFYHIPRLGGKRVQSVKNVFRSFYSGLDKRMFFSSLLFNAAFGVLAVFTVFITYYVSGARFEFTNVLAVAAALALSYAVTMSVCSYCIKRRSKWLSVACLVLFGIAGGIIIAAACAPLDGSATFSLIIVAAALSGVGGAVSVLQTKLRFLTVKPRITSGAVFILLELTACAAGAIAILAAAAVAVTVRASALLQLFSIGGGTAMALAVAAFVCAGKKQAQPQSPLGPSYEFDPPEQESARDDTDGETPSGEQR